MSPGEFIALIDSAAQASTKSAGVPTRFTVPQAALESGWGRAQLATEAMNLFGVKADLSWHGMATS